MDFHRDKKSPVSVSIEYYRSEMYPPKNDWEVVEDTYVQDNKYRQLIYHHLPSNKCYRLWLNCGTWMQHPDEDPCMDQNHIEGRIILWPVVLESYVGEHWVSDM